MTYTAAEMRDKSEQMVAMAKGMRATNSYNPGVIADYEIAAAMLRQAAEAMDDRCSACKAMDREKVLYELASESQRLKLYDVQKPATTKEGE